MKKKGGEIIGKGAGTCVFKPKVACNGESTAITGETEGDFVSRVVLASENEHLLQKVAHDRIKQDLDSAGKSDLLRFFLFGSSYCTPNTKDEDFLFVDDYESCVINGTEVSIKRKPNNNNFVNIITPTFDKDIVSKDLYGRYIGEELFQEPIETTKKGIRDLLLALTYINKSGIVIHFDAHFLNIAWKGEQIVLTDWGKVQTDEKMLNENIKFIEKKYPLTDRYRSYKTFPQLAFTIDVYNHYKDKVDFQAIAFVWDILAIVESADVLRLVKKEDATKFRKTVINLLDKLIKKDLSKYEKSLQEKEALVTTLKQDPNQAGNALIVLLENEIRMLKSLINQPSLTLDDIREPMRTAINDLFSTSGGRRKTRRTLFQKRTRTHNIHKQTICNRQRKSRKTTK